MLRPLAISFSVGLLRRNIEWMAATQFHYLYRDADNYKAHGMIALDGVVTPERWKEALRRLEGGQFFVAEQLEVPPLYQALYRLSGQATSADHCWHTFVDIDLLSEADPSTYHRVACDVFVARLAAVKEWRDDLSPHFGIGPANLSLQQGRFSPDDPLAAR